MLFANKLQALLVFMLLPLQNSSPCIDTPLSGRRQQTFINVDLPAPDGPMMAVSSRIRKCTLTLSNKSFGSRFLDEQQLLCCAENTETLSKQSQALPENFVVPLWSLSILAGCSLTALNRFLKARRS
eukprot:TRINITY_DN43907_c0_g1_i1.p2 TRINITY_DN43907_c0_g1~~TRINITY_DN43907_c0_g1_i1.p2  ORF type:complete len:127 (+),score=10.60 TRINITY_DN43907_c0_g1_i1:18-398(+)